MRILFLAALLCLAEFSFAIPQVMEWNRTYGGSNDDAINSVQQTTDGGYILAGSSGSYGAGDNDFWLVKTNSSGSAQWGETFRGSQYNDQAYSVKQTSDGGYVLAGSRYNLATSSLDFWIIKTNSSGNAQWNKTFGGAGYDEARSVQQTGDGGYVIAGQNNGNVWLVKTNSSGDMQWNKTFSISYFSLAYSVQQTGDGGYALAGSNNGGQYDFLLIRTNSSGDMQWNRSFGGNSYEIAYSVQQTTDGGYILAGDAESFGAGSYDIWLVKTNSSGDMQWNKTFGGASWEHAYSVRQTSDGGYILAGAANSFGAGNTDFWVVKTDSGGDMQWNKTFGGSSYDEASSVIQTADGGYAIAGFTASFGAGNRDGWLIRLANVSDYVPPTTSASAGDYSFGSWTNRSVTASLSCSDSGSGCNRTYYCIDSSNSCMPATVYSGPITLSDDGTNYMRYYSVDSTGNTEPAASRAVMIDTALPYLNIDSPQPDSTLIKRTIAVRVTANDDLSGARNTDVTATDPDGNPVSLASLDNGGTHTALLWVPRDGSYTITATAYDHAGNSESTAISVNVDISGSTQFRAEWNMTFDSGGEDNAQSAVQTDDGGYAIAGDGYNSDSGNNDFLLVKTDSDGGEEWRKTFDYDGGDDRANSVQQTGDGGYILAGQGSSGSSIGWVVKTNSDGDYAWGNDFSYQGDTQFNSVMQTDDGGYIAAGSAYTADHASDFYLAKMGSGGGEEWTKEYDYDNGDDFANSVLQTSDGGYMLAGKAYVQETGKDAVWLVKTDSEGAVQWNATYASSDANMEGNSVIPLSDGYLIAGTLMAPDGYDDFLLIRTDLDGVEQWNTTYDYAGDSDDAYSVQQTSDGGYVLAGKAYDPRKESNGYWIVKTDSDGNEQGDGIFTYGNGSNSDGARSVLQVSGDEYVLGGSIFNPDNGNNDFWLVKATTAPDNDPPATSASADGYAFGSWTNQSVTVSLGCSDADSGCAITMFCTDSSNECTPDTAYSSPVPVSSEGSTYVRFYSQDNWGNSEEVQGKEVDIDLTDPEISIDSPANSTYDSPVLLGFSTNDISGLSLCEYSLDGADYIGVPDCSNGVLGPLSSGGHALIVRAVDNAGNSNSASVYFSMAPESEPPPAPGGPAVSVVSLTLKNHLLSQLYLKKIALDDYEADLGSISFGPGATKTITFNISASMCGSTGQIVQFKTVRIYYQQGGIDAIVESGNSALAVRCR